MFLVVAELSRHVVPVVQVSLSPSGIFRDHTLKITQHVHAQITLLSICYLSCHSNVLLQTVLTKKLQKSRQIDTVCVL